MTNCLRIVFPALVCCLLCTACAATVTSSLLLANMQNGTAPLIVDVRSQGEYERDHVPGAVHIPFSAINSGLHEIGYSKKDPVILYCEHGPRAAIAVFSLFLSGYEHVYVLEGHMKGWRSSDYPVEIILH